MSYTPPLHHHPPDGAYRPDCARCRLEYAAPALYAALLDVVTENDEFGGCPPSSPAWPVARALLECVESGEIG